MESFFKNHKHSHIFHNIQNDEKLSNDNKINNANMLRICIELLGYGRCLTNYEDKIYNEITNNNENNNITRWKELIEYKEYAHFQMNQSLYSELLYDCDEIKDSYYHYFEKYVK